MSGPEATGRFDVRTYLVCTCGFEKKSVTENKTVREMLKPFAEKKQSCDFHTRGEDSASKRSERIFVQISIFGVIS